MPKILLTNDDGIFSPGILSLKKEIDKLGETVVVAPSKEKSGIGKAISSKLVKVETISLPDGSTAYAINGTPADAYMIATYKILGKTPDLLISGINLGPNLGVDDFFTSGTIGAAIEAAVHHAPAIAVSYCMEKFLEGQDKASLVDMETLNLIAKIAAETAKYVLENGMPYDVDLISINVPEKLRSLNFEATTLSYKGYLDLFVNRNGGYVIDRWVLEDYPDDVPGTDLHTVKKRKRIAVTPIKLRFIHNTEGIKGLIEHLHSYFHKSS